MLTVSENFINAQKEGRREILLAFIESRMGRRVYGFQTPTPEQMGSGGGLITYSSGVSIGDGTVFGSQAIVLEGRDLLIGLGDLRETLSPADSNILISLQGQEITGISAVFNNIGYHFSDILQSESFLFQRLIVRQGYTGLVYNDFLQLFSGIIVEETLTETECIVSAEAT